MTGVPRVNQIWRIGSGLFRRCSNCHGTGRVGSGRVRRGSKLTSRVSSGPTRNGSLAGRLSMTRELVYANPRVGPADPARGSDTPNASHFLVEDFCSTSKQYSFGIILHHSNVKTPPDTYVYACPHPFKPLQPGHNSLRGTKEDNKLF